MPPKNNNNNKSKGKNISKEDKRLESYINHPANQASQENQQEKQGKKGKNNNAQQHAKEEEKKKDSTEQQIMDLLKDIDLTKPLPDFANLDNSIATLRTTISDMDELIKNIAENNSAAIGNQPVEQEEQSFKGQQLTPELIKKKEQIIKDVNTTVGHLKTRQARVQELSEKENLAEFKEVFKTLHHNLDEDIKQKQQILTIF